MCSAFLVHALLSFLPSVSLAIFFSRQTRTGAQSLSPSPSWSSAEDFVLSLLKPSFHPWSGNEGLAARCCSPLCLCKISPLRLLPLLPPFTIKLPERYYTLLSIFSSSSTRHLQPCHQAFILTLLETVSASGHRHLQVSQLTHGLFLVLMFIALSTAFSSAGHARLIFPGC